MTQKEYYERILAEKDNTITVLKDEIQFMRGQPTKQKVNEPEFPMVDLSKSWISEEEDDLRQLVEEGRLTAIEAAAAREALVEGLNIS